VGSRKSTRELNGRSNLERDDDGGAGGAEINASPHQDHKFAPRDPNSPSLHLPRERRDAGARCAGNGIPFVAGAISRISHVCDFLRGPISFGFRFAARR